MSKQKRQSEFTQWCGPLLEVLRDLGGSGKPKEVTEKIADKLKVPNSKLEETLKSGQSKFRNQVAWARQYLVWEGLLDSSRKGVWILTKSGWNTALTEQDSRALFLKWVAIFQKARTNKLSEEELIEEQESSEPDNYQITGEQDLLFRYAS